MTAKPKRKHDTRALFKLKLLLVGFAVGTLIFAIIPMIWLAPPSVMLTPFLYIGLSLLWIPLGWQTLKYITWDNVLRGLILISLVSSIFMISTFHRRLSTHFECKPPSMESSEYDYYCSSACNDFSFEAIKFAGILLVTRYFGTPCAVIGGPLF